MSAAEFYGKCYDILVAKVGARESQREAFLAFYGGRGASEWRFGGVFGLWGYFYNNGFPVLHYISAPEATPEKLKLVDEVNADLKALEALHFKEP